MLWLFYFWFLPGWVVAVVAMDCVRVWDGYMDWRDGASMVLASTVFGPLAIFGALVCASERWGNGRMWGRCNKCGRVGVMNRNTIYEPPGYKGRRTALCDSCGYRPYSVYTGGAPQQGWGWGYPLFGEPTHITCPCCGLKQNLLDHGEPRSCRRCKRVFTRYGNSLKVQGR